jgi:hypothetical protein
VSAVLCYVVQECDLTPCLSCSLHPFHMRSEHNSLLLSQRMRQKDGSIGIHGLMHEPLARASAVVT